ncbi:MAG: hypothetical protein K0S12_1878 [Bacteroidetes bacterium]|jgi:peptidoglycan/xylan/chitin deacetylase (PgdA/CDA1 family)|nr:hypothetical protein [Bacteroidota bacterium]
MGVVKNLSRKVILPSLLILGADKFFLRRSKTSCCIINFHGVRKNDNDVFNNRHIPAAEFEKIIKYLVRNYKIVPLSEIFQIHRSKIRQERKTIALTFDDGYENNFTIALPILKKFNVPATFYLISKGLIDKNFYVWPDKIDIIKKQSGRDFTINGINFPAPTYYNQEANAEMFEYLKRQGKNAVSLADDITKDSPQVLEKVKNSRELMELIRESEMKIYANESLLEFGSHTHTHPNLEYLDSETLKVELTKSKELIEKITGRIVNSIAFPDGSYKSEVLTEAAALGYENMVAVDYKFGEENKNPNLLSRFTISNSTTFESNVIRMARDFDKYGFN